MRIPASQLEPEDWFSLVPHRHNDRQSYAIWEFIEWDNKGAALSICIDPGITRKIDKGAQCYLKVGGIRAVVERHDNPVGVPLHAEVIKHRKFKDAQRTMGWFEEPGRGWMA